MTTATQSPAQLAETLAERVTRLSHSLARSTTPALSRTAASVLARLRDAGPQRVTELASHEAVAQPSMSTLVSRLERQGLVQRGDDAADRRAVLVAITPDGERLLAERRAARAATLAARLRRLEPREREALAAALVVLEKLTETPVEERR